MKKHSETTTKFIDILTELLAIPSPGGREEKTRAALTTRLERIGYQPEADPAGNLLVRIPGKDDGAAPTILAAHMDEISLIVTGIEADGRLKVTNLGGLTPCKIGERPVDVIGDGDETVTGLLSMGSGHTSKGKGGEWSPTWDEIWVETGLSSERLKVSGVRVGSSIVPAMTDRGPVIFGDDDDPMIMAWTFDDRAGVAELVVLLERIAESGIKPERPVIVAFTVHEEGGCHGAKVVANRARPDMFIAVDGCPVVGSHPLKIDGRPGVWSKDAKCNYDQELVKELMSAAAEAGTELQPGIFAAASSDASAVYDAGLAPRVGFLGHVRTNSHGFEAARLSVFEKVIDVLTTFVKTRL